MEEMARKITSDNIFLCGKIQSQTDDIRKPQSIEYIITSVMRTAQCAIIRIILSQYIFITASTYFNSKSVNNVSHSLIGFCGVGGLGGGRELFPITPWLESMSLWEFCRAPAQ